MFHRLSAFPLTPLKEGKFDERAFINLLRPVVDAGVDSLGMLGSTGTRISPLRRAHITRCAVEHANALSRHGQYWRAEAGLKNAG